MEVAAAVAGGGGGGGGEEACELSGAAGAGVGLGEVVSLEDSTRASLVGVSQTVVVTSTMSVTVTVTS